MSTTAALRIHRALKWLRVPQDWRLRLMLWEWKRRLKDASGSELTAFVIAARAELRGAFK